jgi:hypothetical protein
MPINNSRLGKDQKIDFIKKCHIFRGLSDDQLEIVVNAIDEMPYPAGRMVVKRGSQANLFFMIYSGKVQIASDLKGKEENQVTLEAGDFFGEEAFKADSLRSSNIVSLADSLFLIFSRQNLARLLDQIPALKTNFAMALESRKLIWQKNYSWVQPEEVLYFLSRRHPFLLWYHLAGPLFALLVPILLFWFSFTPASTVLLILSVVSLFLDICWGFWNWLDWTNDYFIVSNKRVIWLDKVIGLYDSRQEAPLNSVISVGVETNQIGRIYNYGNVIVRTYVGRIVFEEVPHPYQVASLIEEHWVRIREFSRHEDAAAIKQAMRESLGLASREQIQTPRQEPVIQSDYRPGLLQVFFSNLFKTRMEENGIITYRKHWFVLLKTTWLPGSLLIIIVGAIIYQLFRLLVQKFSSLPLISVSGNWFWIYLVTFVLLFGWWLYQFINWQNDIFQVSAEQIIDIDKTPLGSEERKVAPLENILSTEYKRIGLAQVLLNYGNVYITVGGAQIIFNDVTDPTTVQQDIDSRRIAIISQKKEAETRAEREHLADWFAAYHRDSDSFQVDPGRDEMGDKLEDDKSDVK